MAIVIVTTVGDASANSYNESADVDAYAEAAQNGAAWTALSASQATKDAILVRATRLLDPMFRWLGERVTRTQRLEWPRYGVEHPACGCYLSTEIPQAVKDAHAELCLFLATQAAADATVDPFAPAANNLDSLSVGPITLDFLESTSMQSEGASFVFTTIQPILLAGRVVGRGGRLVR